MKCNDCERTFKHKLDLEVHLIKTHGKREPVNTYPMPHRMDHAQRIVDQMNNLSEMVGGMDHLKELLEV